jgi:Tfp pilus assembly protein PilX
MNSMKMALKASNTYCLCPCKNEKGFVLIVAMLMLLVISLMGIFMSNTTTTEVTIAGNEKFSQEQFYTADAAVNTVIAENTVPSDTFKPGALYAVTPFNCNSPLHAPFAQYNIDGNAGNDVAVYLLTKSGAPAEIQVASCATLNNTTAQIIAGIQYGTLPGGQPGTGDPLQLNN